MNNKTFISGLFLFACLPAFMQAQEPRRITVSELFSLVETGSTALSVSQNSVDVAEQAAAQARSSRLPDVSVSMSAAYNGNVLMTDRDFGNARGIRQPHLSNSFAIEAQQTIYSGGAVSAGIRLAEVHRRQAEAGVDMTRSVERFTALGLYLDLFKTDNGIKVYESNIALTEKLIADIRARQAEGMALKNDVTRYELQMETLRLGLRRLQDNRSVLNHKLCTMLGLKETIISPDPSVVSEPTSEQSEAEWQQRAAAASPQLRISALGIESAEEQLTIAKSELRPKLAVFAADNFSGPFTYDLPPIDKNFNVWYVGIGIRYQLSSLFKGNKGVRRAQAAVRKSQTERSDVAKSVNNSMQEAYTLYRQSFVDLRTRQKSVELAASNYQVMNDRYKSQLALVTDMVEASNLKLDAELQEVNARAGIVFAYYRMKFIAGEI